MVLVIKITYVQAVNEMKMKRLSNSKISRSSCTRARGFTLIEMMLVLVIMTSILLMIIGFVQQKTAEMRRDRAAMQIQMILNAALSYYVNNSAWPVTDTTCATLDTGANIAILTNNGYLPSGVNTNNPWGNGFLLNCNLAAGTFTVTTQTPIPQEAQILAGRLPFGGFTTASPFNVTASVTIPGQNLNNARSVNFAGIYSSGACVPAPICPLNMSPAIFVVPVGVSGLTSYPSGGTPQFYPLTDFIAYARGGSASAPTPIANSPLDCARAIASASNVSCQFPIPPVDPPGTTYWRVCLSITTQNGVAYPNASIDGGNQLIHGQALGQVLAITRCVPNKGAELPSGTPFNVWTPNLSGP